MDDLACGDIVWVVFDPTQGREQAGRRPALIVASDDYLAVVDTLAIVVPLTSADRGWPSHIPVWGSALRAPSWAMTEQVRTVSRTRIVGRAGSADSDTMIAVRRYLGDFLGL